MCVLRACVRVCMTLPQPTCLPYQCRPPGGSGYLLGVRLVVGDGAGYVRVHMFVVRVLCGELHDRQVS